MTFSIGTPLWKKPFAMVDGVPTNTLCVAPAATTDEHSEFCGVTVRDGEDSEYELRLQKTGDILARVMGPCAVGDLARQSAGNAHLAVANGKPVVGKVLQAIAGAEVKLVRVRTSSASEGASSEAFPFQVLRVSDTQISIHPDSFLLRSLNARDIQPITGLGKAFTVTPASIVYLEILMDVNLSAFAAAICVADDWAGEFPRMVKTVRKADNAAEKAALEEAFDTHVGMTIDGLAASLETALTKLDAFKNQTATVKQWAAYLPIAFASQAPVSGISLTSGETSFVMVQAVRTHLTLTSFCDSGVPVAWPIPASCPLVETLPAVTFSGTSNISMAVTGHPTAEIYYTLDGSAPSTASTLFIAPISAPTGGQVLKAFAIKSGYFSSSASTYA